VKSYGEDLDYFFERSVGVVFMDLVNDEIEKTVPEWRELKKMNGGFVCQHTICVLW